MIARIHDAILEAGLPLDTVRKLHSGVTELVFPASATPAQRRKAQQIAGDFQPTQRHRIEDAARKRGLTPLQLAVARRELARQLGEQPPAWTGQVLADELEGVDAELA